MTLATKTRLAFAAGLCSYAVCTSAQTLDGLPVQGHFDLPTHALFDLVNERKTVGEGIEFNYSGFGGASWYADFHGNLLTLGLFTGPFQFQTDEPAWRFELTDGRAFTSLTKLTDGLPKPIEAFAFGVQSDGSAFVSLPKWEPIFDQPAQTNTLYTATFQLAFDGPTAPVPESGSGTLLLSGLVLVGAFVSRGREEREQKRRVSRTPQYP